MSELRPIDTSTVKQPIAAPDDLGPAPALDWIPIERLLLDDTYQRPLLPSNWTAIRKIAENFSWSRFQPIVVSPVAGGCFAVVDGQHRAHAAQLIGIETVPAMSCHLTRAEQARAFSWINGNTTAISTFHVYKAAIAAREAWAMDCMAAVEAAGCRIMTYNKTSAQKRAGEIYCISLIREHVDAGRAATVTAGLTALKEGPERDDPFPYAATFLRPWLRTVADKSLADWPLVLGDFLAKHSLYDILHRVEKLHMRPEYAQTAKAKLLQSSLKALMQEHIRATAAERKNTGGA